LIVLLFYADLVLDPLAFGTLKFERKGERREKERKRETEKERERERRKRERNIWRKRMRREKEGKGIEERKEYGRYIPTRKKAFCFFGRSTLRREWRVGGFDDCLKITLELICLWMSTFLPPQRPAPPCFDSY